MVGELESESEHYLELEIIKNDRALLKRLDSIDLWLPNQHLRDMWCMLKILV